jgi:Bacterial regulatory proteins, luxR family
VLELIWRGLTNEEIAQRFDISVAGAKYHVSEILSKLGVETREEAASVSLGKRKRWWSGWPLWAGAAGAAVMAGTAALITLPLWSIYSSPGEVGESSIQSGRGVCAKIVTSGEELVMYDVNCKTREPTGRWKKTGSQWGGSTEARICGEGEYEVDSSTGERLETWEELE